VPHVGFGASLVVGAVALVASTLAAVTGFGGAAVLLPVLVIAFGVRDAVPILTVAQLIGNASRVVQPARARLSRCDLVRVSWITFPNTYSFSSLRRR
jgi:uncharacterized membrane protein YfcA